jgi:chromosome segregation ATPase
VNSKQIDNAEEARTQVLLERKERECNLMVKEMAQVLKKLAEANDKLDNTKLQMKRHKERASAIMSQSRQQADRIVKLEDELIVTRLKLKRQNWIVKLASRLFVKFGTQIDFVKQHANVDQPACSKCGTHLNMRGYCRDITCPYCEHKQNERYVEGVGFIKELKAGPKPVDHRS